MALPQESWVIAKPAKVSEAGIVVAQNALAAEAGAEILAAGGNAVDAAVATAFALGVVEPWMSGIGGAGFLLWAEAGSGKVEVVDFTLVAPRRLDPTQYPLAGGVGGDLFGWPLVEGDRNLRGYSSICVPGSVDGLGLAVERFGRKSWAEVLAPGLRLAEVGLPVTWNTTLSIAVAAPELAEFPASRAQYLPDGFPPAPPASGAPRHLPWTGLARTYRRLISAGRRDFYEGEIAATLAADLAAGGSVIDREDLARYRAQIVAPSTMSYRGVKLHAAPPLSGGPTFLAAMAAIGRRIPGTSLGTPGAAAFVAYAEALTEAFAERLAIMGHAMPGASNTTHLSVVDRHGNMVALTNTLLSRFGSKVVLPQTGITMNNGMMWFDPVPGRPNSMAAGKRPLANMCPVVLTRSGAPWVALGACGGRRIIPAVTQLASFLVDFDMPLERAFTTPRLDASTAAVICDSRMAPEILAALRAKFPVELAEETVYPGPFAMPSAVMRQSTTGRNTGMTHVHSPAAAAVAEP